MAVEPVFVQEVFGSEAKEGGGGESGGHAPTLRKRGQVEEFRWPPPTRRLRRPGAAGGVVGGPRARVPPALHASNGNL